MALTHCPKCGTELNGKKTCPSCQMEIATYTKKFCVLCNKTLVNAPGDVDFIACPKCKTDLQPGSKECPSCGMDLEAVKKRLCYRYCEKFKQDEAEEEAVAPAPSGKNLYMNCPVCQEKISKTAVFCPHCGHPFQKVKKLFGKNEQYVQWFFTCFTLALQIIVLILLVLK